MINFGLYISDFLGKKKKKQIKKKKKKKKKKQQQQQKKQVFINIHAYAYKLFCIYLYME